MISLLHINRQTLHNSTCTQKKIILLKNVSGYKSLYQFSDDSKGWNGGYLLLHLDSWRLWKIYLLLYDQNDCVPRVCNRVYTFKKNSSNSMFETYAFHVFKLDLNKNLRKRKVKSKTTIVTNNIEIGKMVMEYLTDSSFER